VTKASHSGQFDLLSALISLFSFNYPI